MDQLSIFGNAATNDLLPGLIDYRPGMFTKQESDLYLDKFIAKTPWEQKSVLMYGKEVITPRLTAWFGDEGVDYSIAGNELQPLPWTADLLVIKQRVEAAADMAFNSVLLNYYRNGNDSVSWHDDRDGIPGRNHIVASVSLGAERTFDIRNKADNSQKYSILLEDGSYLLMKGNFQEQWQHRIAKSAKTMKARVNLTFRVNRQS